MNDWKNTFIANGRQSAAQNICSLESCGVFGLEAFFSLYKRNYF